jgi:hypothetical protein
MSRRFAAALAVAGLVLGAARPALPCSICAGVNMNALTLRQEVGQAKLVLYGTLANPRLNPGALAGGTTDLVIERVLKDDPFLAGRNRIELPRYVPVDPKNPPKFLVFCDVFNGKLDPYRGTPAKSAVIVDYLRGAAALPKNDRQQELLYFFRYLENADPDIARDAFLEFAKANDEEVGQVAAKLTPGKIGGWLRDPQIPTERLSLYAFLLGACGGDAEAQLLEGLVQKPDDRVVNALGGLLAGYIQLRPREGWSLCYSILRSTDKPYLERFGALGTLRFYHGWKGDGSRREVLRGMDSLIAQGDIADLAIEDLRRWKYWELTGKVLEQYGKKSHDAPIMKRTIVRYAISCPQPEAKTFLQTLRAKDPELVKEVEESLQFEKQK